LGFENLKDRTMKMIVEDAAPTRLIGIKLR